MANFSNEQLKSIVHAALVCGGGIPVSLQHDSPLEEAKGCCNSSVFDIIWVNSYLEEQVSHIKLAPDFSFGTVSKDVIDLREQVHVRDCTGIQYSVVIDPMQFSSKIGFWDEEGRKGVRAVRRMEMSSCKVLIKK